MSNDYSYLIGVDGGGTGTRAVVASADGTELARGTAGPSGLRHGADFAWNSILAALAGAFKTLNQPVPDLNRLAIGLGLAGVHNKQWANAFRDKNPGFSALALDTDAFTTLLGAHRGQPGAIVALGTGSCGESMNQEQERHEVGGWGFPFGDEASGAWLGWQAVRHLQHTLDGRAAPDPFATAVLARCGGSRDQLFNWLASASQGSYAQLAPAVVEHAASGSAPEAVAIMQHGAQEIQSMVHALDPTQRLPVALCGSLAQFYLPYLPQSVQNRLIPAQGDSCTGALILLSSAIEGNS